MKRLKRLIVAAVAASASLARASEDTVAFTHRVPRRCVRERRAHAHPRDLDDAAVEVASQPHLVTATDHHVPYPLFNVTGAPLLIDEGSHHADHVLAPPSPSPSRPSAVSSARRFKQRRKTALHAMIDRIRSYGLAGMLSYGVLNALYYTVAVALAWCCRMTCPSMAAPSLRCATQRFVKVFVLVWAGSQVTKGLRAAMAVMIAPFVDKVLAATQRRLRLKTRERAFAVCCIMLLGGTFGVFGVLVLSSCMPAVLLTTPAAAFMPPPTIMQQQPQWSLALPLASMLSYHLTRVFNNGPSGLEYGSDGDTDEQGGPWGWKSEGDVLKKRGKTIRGPFSPSAAPPPEDREPMQLLADLVNTHDDSSAIITQAEEGTVEELEAEDEQPVGKKAPPTPPKSPVSGWNIHPKWMTGRWHIPSECLSVVPHSLWLLSPPQQAALITALGTLQHSRIQLLPRGNLTVSPPSPSLQPLSWRFTPATRRLVVELQMSDDTGWVLRYSGRVKWDRGVFMHCDGSGAVRLRTKDDSDGDMPVVAQGPFEYLMPRGERRRENKGRGRVLAEWREGADKIAPFRPALVLPTI
ncbi:unnamed protein product [Vitrella brassicaformis CCMP3155]|uniref:Uncharacterized protein n=1 Tax=Vitrella brassicaformis (strain CCMP3155) TaxID=1169540 RepID=A0A0G4FS21_VITBC|nr:unnamed protein product [Vitrella brassicaformis CCMP3155]|eukprot:CEM16907.1 unnamed protein product [Vitrella brassicaformis CCMP3155]